MIHCCDGVILCVITDRTDREALWVMGGHGFLGITLQELRFHSTLEQLISSTVVADSHTHGTPHSRILLDTFTHPAHVDSVHLRIPTKI